MYAEQLAALSARGRPVGNDRVPVGELVVDFHLQIRECGAVLGHQLLEAAPSVNVSDSWLVVAVIVCDKLICDLEIACIQALFDKAAHNCFVCF
jgi:hypothetical protein